MGFQSMRFSWCGGDHPETFSDGPVGRPSPHGRRSGARGPCKHVASDRRGQVGRRWRMRLQTDCGAHTSYRRHGGASTSAGMEHSTGVESTGAPTQRRAIIREDEPAWAGSPISQYHRTPVRRGSVEHGLSAAGLPFIFYWPGLAADKRYR